MTNENKYYTPKPILDYVLAESAKVEMKIIDYTQGTGAFLTDVVRLLREYDAIGVIMINPPFNAPNTESIRGAKPIL